MNERVTARIPLVRALADLRRARTPGTVAMYVVLAATMLVLASVPVCGAMQDQLARAHHARPASLATWTAVQLVPKMYSFAHRIWLRGSASAATGSNAERSLWINHYPVRAARFEHGRGELVTREQDVYLLIRSGYQGRRWVSHFVVRPRGGELVLELLEATP